MTYFSFQNADSVLYLNPSKNSRKSAQELVNLFWILNLKSNLEAWKDEGFKTFFYPLVTHLNQIHFSILKRALRSHQNFQMIQMINHFCFHSHQLLIRAESLWALRLLFFLVLCALCFLWALHHLYRILEPQNFSKSSRMHFIFYAFLFYFLQRQVLTLQGYLLQMLLLIFFICYSNTF